MNDKVLGRICKLNRCNSLFLWFHYLVVHETYLVAVEKNKSETLSLSISPGMFVRALEGLLLTSGQGLSNQ